MVKHLLTGLSVLLISIEHEAFAKEKCICYH